MPLSTLLAKTQCPKYSQYSIQFLSTFLLGRRHHMYSKPIYMIELELYRLGFAFLSSLERKIVVVFFYEKHNADKFLFAAHSYIF